MIKLSFANFFLAVILTVILLPNPAHSQSKPFLPPQPIEGELRAYNQLLQTLSLGDDVERVLRSLNLARDMTAGPTKLRAYIDCLRIGALLGTGQRSSALEAGDECVATFPEHPAPKFFRGMARVHNYQDANLLVEGTDDLIAAFRADPGMYHMISFDDLASPIRGLAAAGEEEKKAELVKAYFSPLYVPPPNPGANSSLISGIGVLLESGENGLASRLAGFLQKKNDVVGLLSFKPASPIWPALEVRHSQGYEAARQAWALMDDKIDTFDAAKVSLLSALSRWEHLQTLSKDAINQWDGKDGDAVEVLLVNEVASNLWNAGLRKESISLSTLLLEKAGSDVTGQIVNTAFNAGYRMILFGQADKGRSIIKPFIKKMEQDSSEIEWKSGSAFLDAIRVCAYEGAESQKALRALEDSSGDLYNQRNVAYQCLQDAAALAKMKAERLTGGPMADRLNLAISLAQLSNDSTLDPKSTSSKAMEIDPLKSSIQDLMRSFPDEK